MDPFDKISINIWSCGADRVAGKLELELEWTGKHLGTLLCA